MRQVCVIGLGQFGSHLARMLVKFGCEVLVIDASEARIDEIRDDVHRAIIGDARSHAMLESVLSDTVQEAVIALGADNIEPSILCALNLKKLGVPRIRSTAANDDHAEILRAVGADEIVFPERSTAERLARHIANPNLRDLFPLEDDYRIMELTAPPKLHGKTLGQVNLRREYNVLVLAVRAPDEERFRFLPDADMIVRPDEVLMVLGRELDLARFSELK